VIYYPCKLFWIVVFTFLSVLSLIFYFECVVTLVTDGLDSPFLCKGSNSTSVKLFFSVSAQPQLLEVGSPRDIGIVSRILLHLVLLFDLLFYFLSFIWSLHSCENWIELNCLPLPLHLNTKPQISLCIFTLDSLQYCTILVLKIIHPRAIRYESRFFESYFNKPD
jgi:hypothetical protein